MIDENPLVTVIAACYNHEKFVSECLESIRNQTYPNIQLIITDDCSTDQSGEIIEAWIKTHGIKCSFIKHTQNMGLPRTLNEALSYAEGRYLSIISTDDYWLPKFVGKLVEVFEDCDESYGVVYSQSYKINEDGSKLPDFRVKRSPVPEGFILKELLVNGFIPANAVMIRHSCFEKIGYYDEDLSIEDYDMWLRIAKDYKFKYSPEAYSIYRVHDSSFHNSRLNDMGISHAKIFLKQLELNPQFRDLIDRRLISYRLSLYKINHPLAKKYLWKGYKRNHSRIDLFRSVCVSLKIPYSGYRKLYNNFHFFFYKNHRQREL